MRRCRGFGRLGGLAVGLGIGAALAATPGAASADPSTDLSWIDQLLGGLSVPAPAAALDMQISIDGMDLFPTAGNTATASSGMGDIAIAIGTGSDALAVGGSFNFALADGTNSLAAAGEGNLDSATVFGNDSAASAIFGNDNLAYVVNTGSTLESASAGGFNAVLGNNDIALAVGAGGGAFAGSDMSTAGNFDLAAVFGNMLTATLSGVSNLFDILGPT